MATSKKGASRPPSSGVAEEIRSRIRGISDVLTVPDPRDTKNPPIVDSTGLLSLDYALQIGGFARGRIHSVEGPPGSGKTSLVLSAIGARQRSDPSAVCAFIDMEGTYDDHFARILGVDTHQDRLILIQPESAEDACKIALSLMAYEPVGKNDDGEWERNPKLVPISEIAYDSWAGSPTKGVGLALLARVGSLWIPKLSGCAKRTDTKIYWINHIREKPGVMFGSPEYSPGGLALKHHQTTRVWVHTADKELDEAKNRIGHQLRIDVQKNKLASGYRRAFINLNYFHGFDRIADTFYFLESHGVSLKEKPDGNLYAYEFKNKDGEKEKIRENGIKAFLASIKENRAAGEAFLGTGKFVASSG